MKTQRRITGYLLISALFVLTVFSVTEASDWPNWRGPDYNGISAEKDWDPSKIKDGMEPLWKASIGIGFSTISVSDDRAYTMGNTGVKGEDESKHNDVIFCFDAETGKELWRHTYPQQLDPKYYEGGSLATPTVNSDKVYTISKDGKAFCLEAKTGKVIWQKNLSDEFGIKRTTWGYSGSPVVVDNVVIYNAGSKGIALNKDNGSLIWQSGEGPGGYATAVPFMTGDQKCIAMFGFEDIIGLVVTTGKELWRFPWKTKNDVNAADPIVVGDKIFISSGYGIGCALIKIEDGKVVELWRNKNMHSKMNGPVFWKDYIYGVDEGGELRCLDIKTGQIAWAQNGFGQGGSVAMADGKLIALGEKGNLVIADATADGYKVIAEAKILSPICWSVPVLANGRLYARNSGGDLVCLDVSKKAVLPVTPVAAISTEKNWAQWRGPNRDGKSTETGLLKSWPEGGPKMIWTAEGLGGGFSSVSIANGFIYTTGIINNEGILSALDLRGDIKWSKSYGPEWIDSHAGTRGTPTVNDGCVYVISGLCAVTCFDAVTGEKKWSVDVLKDFEGKYGKWGVAESPLVVGNKVICTPGGQKASLVALDKKTGKVIWAAKGNGEGNAYCSPQLIEKKDRKIIVTMLENFIIGVDESNGNVLWEYDCKNYQGEPKDINPNTPIYYDSCIYVTSGYGKGGAKLKLSEDGSKVVSQEWANLSLDCHHGGVVLVDGYIYGTSHKGNWVCLDWNDGKEICNTEGIGKSSIIYADGMLYCYDEKQGTVGLVKPTPEKFERVSSFNITSGTGEHWAHPVILDAILYIRHGDALMAYDIKAK